MSRAALAFTLLAAFATARARADEPVAPHEDDGPPVNLAIGTGISLAVAPMLAGAVLYASSDDDNLRRAGALIAAAGLVLAPTVAHLVVREYKRAAIFAALPLVGLVASAVVFAIDPKVTSYGSAETRTTFGVAMTAATLGATVGLADAFGARDCWRRRHPILGAAF